MTRIGLSALVTMTRTNFSVVTSAIVSLGSLVTPAFTNNRSKTRPDRRAQGRDLIGLANIDGLDLEPLFRPVGEIVRRGPGVPPNRADHAPSALQIGLGHRMAEAARGANQQDGLAWIRGGHGKARGR